MRPRKAVILAAGAGTRLSLGGPGIPKPLLPVNGSAGSATLLDRHVRCLAAAGVRDIFIVGNTITFESPVAAVDANVRWILNATSRSEDTGSGHSAWIAFTSAFGILDGASDVLLMDADIAYGAELLPSVFHHDDDGHSRIVVASDLVPNDDAVEVYVDDGGIPRVQGKHLAGTSRVRGLRFAGVATGILVWHPSDHAPLLAVSDSAMHQSQARTRTEHEDLTQLMIERGRMQVVGLPPECPFIEVDTPADYEELKTRVAPRLT